jgi:hypothetical protein
MSAMTRPDLEAVAAAAQTYPYADWREDVSQTIYLLACAMPFEEATRKAFAWADRERQGARGREVVSLDELLSEYGDVLPMIAITPPQIGSKAERARRRRDYGGTGKRKTGKTVQDEGLTHLVSVIANLVERGVVKVDALTCAIDVRAQRPAIRRALVGVICGATRAELSEAGVSWRVRLLAEDWLSRYARLRPDVCP